LFYAGNFCDIKRACIIKGWAGKCDANMMSIRDRFANYPRVIGFIAFLIKLTIGGALLLSPSLILFYKGQLSRADLPKLLLPMKTASTEPTIGLFSPLEILRWSIFTTICLTVSLVNGNLALIIPFINGYFARHKRRSLPQLLLGPMEFVSYLSSHIFGSLTMLTIWMVFRFLFSFEPFPLDSSVTLDEGMWRPQPWQYFGERFCCWLFVLSLLVGAEKAAMHLLISSFQKTVYMERVYECMRSLWVIKTLSKAAQYFNFISINTINKRKQNSRVFWQPRNCPFSTDGIVSKFLLENMGTGNYHSSKAEQLNTVFKFLVGPNEQLLKRDHLAPFFTQEALDGAYRVFDEAELACSDGISLATFKKSVNRVYEERKTLVKILTETNDLFNRLDYVLLVVVGLAAFMAIFPIIGFSPLKAFLPIGISMAPVIFILTIVFAESIKSIAAAIVFIFFNHPFDIGDLVYMDKVQYFCKEIRLLGTTFMRWDGVIVNFPNAVLANMTICNVRRTKFQSFRFEIGIDKTTPTSKLTLIDQKLQEYVQADSREVASVANSCFELRPETNTLVMVLRFQLRFNFQDPARRARNVNKFLSRVQQILHGLDIAYKPPMVEVASVDDPLF
jgi:hypothetical protein